MTSQKKKRRKLYDKEIKYLAKNKISKKKQREKLRKLIDSEKRNEKDDKLKTFGINKKKKIHREIESLERQKKTLLTKSSSKKCSLRSRKETFFWENPFDF